MVQIHNKPYIMELRRISIPSQKTYNQCEFLNTDVKLLMNKFRVRDVIEIRLT
jgi:hypothetical protein